MNPPQTPPQSPISPKYAPRLTRDERFQSSGRNPLLRSAQIVEEEAYITSSQGGRQMPYFEVVNVVFPHFGVSEKVIERKMKKRGYTRRIAASKPPLSPENLRKPYDFVRNHLHWEKEDWMRVLWTDESWVNDGRHARCWITRKPDEVYDNTCVVSNFRRRIGWIFWGSFFGSEKGLCLFWEKEWGSIAAERYSERIVPLIHGTVSMRPDSVVMQDNAPSHSAARTKRELSERNIVPLEWPPFSPDLNPIEHVWNMMKIIFNTNSLT
ncbi:hypothetical protein K3495_g3620 [Podosphaera aphanis]|nr:hypothetical protein K3495_g3620 [Podosphaera aphanis]